MKFITLIATAFLFFSLNINESESKCLADTITWCDSIQNAIDCNVFINLYFFISVKNIYLFFVKRYLNNVINSFGVET